MRQLLLLRHAKASRDDPDLSDHERPLTKRGVKDAATMRRLMRELGLQPDVVLVSPAKRAQQTLAGLEPFDDTPIVETLDGLYMAGPGQILQILQTLPDTARSVLVIGHNPGLHELALLLADKAEAWRRVPELARMAEKFPTAALAEFQVSGSWQDLGVRGTRLVGFLIPREITKAAD